MSYLPDIYKHFERAFPTVQAAHQELARRRYEVGPLDERSVRLVRLADGGPARPPLPYRAPAPIPEAHPPEPAPWATRAVRTSLIASAPCTRIGYA
jgi:hypothetical protein